MISGFWPSTFSASRALLISSTVSTPTLRNDLEKP